MASTTFDSLTNGTIFVVLAPDQALIYQKLGDNLAQRVMTSFPRSAERMENFDVCYPVKTDVKVIQ